MVFFRPDATDTQPLLLLSRAQSAHMRLTCMLLLRSFGAIYHYRVTIASHVIIETGSSVAIFMTLESIKLIVISRFAILITTTANTTLD